MGFLSSRRARMRAAFLAWQTKITNEKQAIENARLQALEDEAVSKSTSYISDINSAKDSIETSVSSITSKLTSISGYSNALHSSSTSADALTQYNHMVAATKDLSDLFTTLIQQKTLLDTAKDGLEKSKGSYDSTTTIYNNGVTAYNSAVASFNSVKTSTADADEMIADGSAAMASMKVDESKSEALSQFLRSDTSDTMSGDLTVDGSITAKLTGTSGGLRLHTNSGITASANLMNFFTSQTAGWSFNANGTGADTDQKVTIDLSGNIIATGDIVSNSDKRLKSDIKPIENALEIVKSLEGKTYIKDEKESIGLIAQEVEEILPEMVHTADDEMKTKSVNYQNMVAVLIEAVKDQQQQIDELKEQLNGV